MWAARSDGDDSTDATPAAPTLEPRTRPPRRWTGSRGHRPQPSRIIELLLVTTVPAMTFGGIPPLG
jgi:hypothetical protein